VICLEMGLEHGGDRNPLALGQRYVVSDQINVRIHHRELAVAFAAEEVRGTGGVVVEELAKKQRSLRSSRKSIIK
jgi:hypothetical protein